MLTLGALGKVLAFILTGVLCALNAVALASVTVTVALGGLNLAGSHPTGVKDAEPAPRGGLAVPTQGPLGRFTAVATQTATGTGDDSIQTLDLGGLPALVSFQCNDCTGATVVRTNGLDGVLVDTQGPYYGEHLVDIFAGSTTDEFEVTATGSWALTVRDLSEVPAVDGPVEGHGDTVLYFGQNPTRPQSPTTGSAASWSKALGPMICPNFRWTPEAGSPKRSG